MNNQDSILNKRNKLNDVRKGKYENPKKSNDPQFNSNNNNNKKANAMMNNQLKNDTYESVCSPEDVAERTKMAQRHTMNHNAIALNNGARVLKRVVSAPVENRGE